jgi:hypothetical protein
VLAHLVFLMVFGAIHEIGPMVFTGMFGVLFETIQGIQGRRRNRGAYTSLTEKILAKSDSTRGP